MLITSLFQAHNILERHLVIADRKFTMQGIKNLGNEIIALPSLRDTLRFKITLNGDRKYKIDNLKQ